MPELGDLFEGLVSGQERQRQLHKELADRAIQQAKMEQDAQEFQLKKETAANLAGDRKSDNIRQLYGMATPLLAQGYTGEQITPYLQNAARGMGMTDAEMPQFSFPASPKLLAEQQDKAARLKVAQERMQSITDDKKRARVQKAYLFNRDRGMDELSASEDALRHEEMANAAMNGTLQAFIDKLDTRGSVLPPNAGAVLGGESTPKFQMQQARADSQNAINTARLPGIRTANELKALELQYKKQLWPETIKNAKLLGDVRKATAKNIELINKYLPQQRESQINSANAAAGAALARTKTLLDELTERQHNRDLIPQGAPYYMVNGVIKENPADPLQATNIQSKRRDVLAKAHKNYSDTTRDIAKVSSALGAVRNETAKAMVALDALPEGSIEWQTKRGELQQYQQYGQRLHDSLNAMSATAAEQLKVMEDLRKRLGEDTKRKREAANAVPNSRVPAVTSTRPGATGLAKVTPPPNMRPNTAAQTLPKMQMGKVGDQRTKKGKPDFSKMSDAELKAWRPGK